MSIPYIRHVTTNWKTFEGDAPREYEMGPLTLVVGDNGTGKSSLVQSIRFACHSVGVDLLMRSETPGITAEVKDGRKILSAASGNHLWAQIVTDSGKLRRTDLRYENSVQSPYPSGAAEVSFSFPVSDILQQMSGDPKSAKRALLCWAGISDESVIKSLPMTSHGTGHKIWEAVKLACAEKNVTPTLEHVVKRIDADKRQANRDIQARNGELEEADASYTQDDYDALRARYKEAEALLEQAIAFEATNSDARQKQAEHCAKLEQEIAAANSQKLENATKLAKWSAYVPQAQAWLEHCKAQVPEVPVEAMAVRKFLEGMAHDATPGRACPCCRNTNPFAAGRWALDEAATFEQASGSALTAVKAAETALTDAQQAIDTIQDDQASIDKDIDAKQYIIDELSKSLGVDTTPVEDPGCTVHDARTALHGLRGQLLEAQRALDAQKRNRQRIAVIQRLEKQKANLATLSKDLREKEQAAVTKVVSALEARVTERLPQGWKYHIIQKTYGAQTLLRGISIDGGPVRKDPSGAQAVIMLCAEAAVAAPDSAVTDEGEQHTLIVPHDRMWSATTLADAMEAFAKNPPKAQVILQSTVYPARDVEGWTVVDLGCEAPRMKAKAEPRVYFGDPDDPTARDAAQVASLSSRGLSPRARYTRTAALPEPEVGYVDYPDLKDAPSDRAAELRKYCEDKGRRALRKVHRDTVGSPAKKDWSPDEIIENIIAAEAKAEEVSRAAAQAEALMTYSIGDWSLKSVQSLMALVPESQMREVAVILQVGENASTRKRNSMTKVAEAMKREGLEIAIFRCLELKFREVNYLETLGWGETDIQTMPLNEARRKIAAKEMKDDLSF